MKQLVSAYDMASLSPVAKKKLHSWLEEKGYGSTFDGKFVSATQLSIGQMLEFLSENGSLSLSLWEEGWQLTIVDKIHEPMFVKELSELLFDAVKEILESKN